MNNTLKNKILAAMIEVKILEGRYDELKTFKNFSLNTTTINNRLVALKGHIETAKKKLENLRTYGKEESPAQNVIVLELSLPVEKFNRKQQISSIDDLIQFIRTEKIEMVS